MNDSLIKKADEISQIEVENSPNTKLYNQTDDHRFYITYEGGRPTPKDLINIQINLKNRKPIYVKKITLKLIKSQSIFFDSEVKEESKKVLEIFNVYENPLEFESFSSGHHKFPVGLFLNKALSGSINSEVFSNSGRLRIENRYFLEIVATNEANFPFIRNRKELLIRENPPSNVLSNVKIEFSYCFCFFYSECELMFHLDSVVYNPGEMAVLEVSSNYTLNKFKIKQVRVELMQCVKTNFRQLKVDDEKVIFKTKGFYDSETNKYVANIRIPRSVHSSICDKNFNIENQLAIFILFQMADPIKIKKEIRIANLVDEPVELNDYDVLEGITQPVQFLEF